MGRTQADDLLKFVAEHRIFGVVRTETKQQALQAARAAAAGGVKLIEITMTIPNGLDLIAELRHSADLLVGAGSVIDAEVAREAIDLGAQFVVSPHTDPAIISAGRRAHVLVISGGATPTEIIDAWKLGADLIKVFPASSFGGPAHLKAILEPLPFLRLMPTGGVNAQNMLDYFRAGAFAVGVGGSLFDQAAIAGGDYHRITERAVELTRLIKQENL